MEQQVNSSSGKLINANDHINIPKNIVHRRIDDHFLFISPQKSTWIVTNEIGAFLMFLISEGCSIQDVVEITAGELGLNTEKIISELKQLLIEIETKGFYENNGLLDDDETYPKMRLHLYVTRACNLSCIHCYMNGGKAFTDELSTKELCNVIDVFTKLHGADTVNFSGGEPLLRKDIFEIMNHAKLLGHRIVLLTNGTLIDKNIASRLAISCDRVQVS